MSQSFQATVALDGRTATGISVPEEVVAALGGGGRVPVRATLNGYTYRTTIARMHGEYKFPVSAAVREAASVTAGDVLDVTLTRDDAPREVTVPAMLQTALDADPAARERFASLSYTNRKRHVLAIESARTDETRARRLAKVLDELTHPG